MRKYVIMGIQGSGKGTQAKMLAADLDLVHISVGDIFRWNVQNHTKLGAQVRRVMAAGELVGDDLVESVVRDRLTQHDWNFGFIIDGFPRDPRQAEFFLESYDIDGVIELDLPDSEVRRRVLNRRLCGDCGMDYNLIANSPKVPGRCDMCGGELITRKMTPRRRSRSGSGTITTRPTPSWRSSGARSTSTPWTRGPRRRSSSSRSGSASACRRTSRETGHPKLREIAVFGRTAHPALAAEICADLGVRRAASQASSAAAWPCCPVAAAQRATMVIRSCRDRDSRSRLGTTRVSPETACRRYRVLLRHCSSGPWPGGHHGSGGRARRAPRPTRDSSRLP